MEKGRHLSAAPRSCKIGLLILPAADIEPDRRTYDKYHKHDGGNGLSVHKSVLLFLLFEADKAKNACADNGNSRKAYP